MTPKGLAAIGGVFAAIAVILLGTALSWLVDEATNRRINIEPW